jgi:hypothetical protein
MTLRKLGTRKGKAKDESRNGFSGLASISRFRHSSLAIRCCFLFPLCCCEFYLAMAWIVSALRFLLFTFPFAQFSAFRFPRFDFVFPLLPPHAFLYCLLPTTYSVSGTIEPLEPASGSHTLNY